MKPFLCIITPVFEPALKCVRALIKSLKQQTYQNFIHVCISNGLSPRIKKLIESQNDPRFIYDEIIYEPFKNSDCLIINLGRRREYGLKKYDADRYTFLDADFKLLKTIYFAELKKIHDLTQAPIILASVKNKDIVLPIYPITLGRIDIANYTFSQKVAKQYSYPTDIDFSLGYANDFRFFKQIQDLPMEHLDLIFGEKDGNNQDNYRRISNYTIGERLEPMLSVFGNNFDQDDLDGMEEVMSSHLVGMGKVTQQFEKEFAAKIGFPYAIATNSCTNAFYLICKALKLSRTDQVIVPNIHFFGIKNVLNLFNVDIVISDVSETTPNLTLANIKDKITPYTRAIIFLEYGGHPLNIIEIKDYLASIYRNDICLILDAANSPFTKFNNRYTVLDYDIAAYSFDLNKILVTGDGGMLLVKDYYLAEKLKSLSYYGIADLHKSGFEKSKTSPHWWEVDITTPSLKLAMNNLNASLGLTQLRKIETNLQQRKDLLKYYLLKLQNLSARGYITLPMQDSLVENNVYLFWIRVNNRDVLAKYLLDKGIYTTVKYQPLDVSAETPNAFNFYQSSLCLPFNQNITHQDVDYVVEQITIFLGCGAG